MEERPRTAGPLAPSGVKRVAVLPFENLGAPEDDYFADGIADEIRGKLTSLPGLEVIARGSSTPYKKTTKTPQEIAQELSANYLLTATVRWQKSGGAATASRSNPELVEIKSRQPAGLEVAAAVRRVPDRRLPGAVRHRVEGRRSAGPRSGGRPDAAALGKADANLAAYDAFLKGEEASPRRPRAPTRRAFGRRFRSTSRRSRSIPSFALAWSKISVDRGPALRQRRSNSGDGASARAGRRKGDRSRAAPARGVSGARRLLPARPRRLRARAAGVREGAQDRARPTRPPPLHRASSRPVWDSGMRPSIIRRQSVRLDPRAPTQSARRHPPAPPADQGGERGVGARSRARAFEPESSIELVG